MWNSRIALGLVLLDLSLIACLGAAAYVRCAERRHLHHYKAVVGKIAQSKVVESSYERDGRLESVHRAVIAYEYSVDGRWLRGSRVRWFDLFDRGAAQARGDVQRYRSGSLVPVYYDPDQPGQAVLELEYTNGFIAPAIALAAVNLCVSLVLRALGFTRARAGTRRGGARTARCGVDSGAKIPRKP